MLKLCKFNVYLLHLNIYDYFTSKCNCKDIIFLNKTLTEEHKLYVPRAIDRTFSAMRFWCRLGGGGWGWEAIC